MNVLICVDESEFADCVVDFVASHEWPAKTEFVVLHVVPSLLPVSAAFPIPVIEGMGTDALKAGKELVHRIALQLKEKGLNHVIQEEVDEGDAKVRILSWAKRLHSSTIALGSHGRRGFDRILLGSVSLAVASSAPCSVIVVRPPHVAAKPAKELDYVKESVK